MRPQAVIHMLRIKFYSDDCIKDFNINMVTIYRIC